MGTKGDDRVMERVEFKGLWTVLGVEFVKVIDWNGRGLRSVIVTEQVSMITLSFQFEVIVIYY